MDGRNNSLTSVLKAEGLNDSPVCVLIVGGDAAIQSSLMTRLSMRRVRCACTDSWHDARDLTGRTAFDVLMIDSDLLHDTPQEAERLCTEHPGAQLVAFTTGDLTSDALGAMRAGAADLVHAVDDLEDLSDRVERAVINARRDQHQIERVKRLSQMCSELNVARSEFSEQVDSLCNELASTYEDVASQIDEATMATEFRTLLSQELDVEELLRTSLEYMLAKIGPTNAAVFLPDEEDHHNLGAYVNYDCPRDRIAPDLERMCESVCPQMAEEFDLVLFDDGDDFTQWACLDSDALVDSQVIAMSCHHDGQCLAIFVLFRDKQDPYENDLAARLDLLREIFACQLARLVRIHHRMDAPWPDNLDDDGEWDEFGFGGYEGGLAA